MTRAGLEDHLRRLTDQVRDAEAEIDNLKGHLRDGDNLHAKLKEDARLSAEEISSVREEAYDKEKMLRTQVREFSCDLNYGGKHQIANFVTKKTSNLRTCNLSLVLWLPSNPPPLPPLMAKLLWTFKRPF